MEPPASALGPVLGPAGARVAGAAAAADGEGRVVEQSQLELLPLAVPITPYQPPLLVEPAPPAIVVERESSRLPAPIDLWSLSSAARLAARSPLAHTDDSVLESALQWRRLWSSVASTSSGSGRRRTRSEAEDTNAGAEVPPDRKRTRTRSNQPQETFDTSLAAAVIEAINAGEDHSEVLAALPDRKHADALLAAVSAVLFGKEGVGGIEALSQGGDRFQYGALDALMSPLRKPSVWELWSPQELALFEAGLCSVGKNFYEIAKLIPGKSTGEVVSLYYHWKQTRHYEMYKELGKPMRKMPSSRFQVWKNLEKSMEPLSSRMKRTRP